ncbi:hypothetical protein D9M71_671210 [compost metagenome]
MTGVVDARPQLIFGLNERKNWHAIFFDLRFECVSIYMLFHVDGEVIAQKPVDKRLVHRSSPLRRHAALNTNSPVK